MHCKTTARERNIPSLHGSDATKKAAVSNQEKCVRDLRTPDAKFLGTHEEKCETLWCGLKKADHIDNVYCPASIWGYTQYCCQCLTIFDCQSKFDKFKFHAFDLQNEGCSVCKVRDTEWKWFGVMVSSDQYKPKENYKSIWYKLDGAGEFQVPDKDTVKKDQVVGLEFPKHLTEVPHWLNTFPNLARVKLNFCTLLPPDAAHRIATTAEQVQSIECLGCPQFGLPENLVSNTPLVENLGVETLKALRGHR